MFYPMLCETYPATEEAVRQLNGTHIFERKYDGIRAVLAINDGDATLTNRNGVDISHRYPEIIRKALDYDAYMGVGSVALVLDGEILVEDETGEWNFALAHRRDAQSKASQIALMAEYMPATFMAFDVLYDGVDLRKLSLATRLEHLEKLADDDGLFTRGGIYTSQAEAFWDDGEDALRDAIGNGWEGIVAKRLNSTYSNGRSSAWKKIKPVKTGSFIVLGLEPGNGSRADTFGAVHIGVKTVDGFRAVGKVGSGFTGKDLQAMKVAWSDVEAGRIPPPVIEVSYQEVSTKGALRFPVFKCVRTDVSVDDCTAERQLG